MMLVVLHVSLVSSGGVISVLDYRVGRSLKGMKQTNRMCRGTERKQQAKFFHVKNCFCPNQRDQRSRILFQKPNLTTRQDISDFITNTLICVPKINEGLRVWNNIIQ